MPPDDRLVTIASELVTNLSDGLTNAGLTVPSRAYIHSGNWVADFTEENCADAFIVSFQGFLQGQQSSASTNPLPGLVIKCAVPLVAQFDVILLRCVPSLTTDAVMPSTAALNQAGTDLLIDAMTLTKILIDDGLAGDLISGPCSIKAIGAVLPVGPEGGVGGNLVNFYVEMA